MDKKITDKKAFQLEFDFECSYSEKTVFNYSRTVIISNHRHTKIKKLHHHNIAQIININDCFHIMKKKKEDEIISFIVNNSKSF